MLTRRQTLAGSAALLATATQAHAATDDLAALYAAAKQEGKVAMYTSVPTFLLKRWQELFQTTYPGIEVSFFRSGTGKVLARIDSELRAGALGGDVVWMADPTAFAPLVKSQAVLSYRPPEWEKLSLAKDPQGYFVAGRILLGVILANPKAGPVANSFADLAKPEMKGKICIASPLISGSTNMIDAALLQAPGFGWSYFEALKKNDVLVLNDVPDVARAVASGERSSGISLTLYKYQPEYQNSPMEIIMPSEGAVPVASPVGVFAKAPHPNAAKLFYRFLLSVPAQNILSENGIYPANSDAAPPTGLPPLDKLKLLQPDPAWLMANQREIQGHWRGLFG
jgi:iron(III) transport system substrate-binding protein